MSRFSDLIVLAQRASLVSGNPAADLDPHRRACRQGLFYTSSRRLTQVALGTVARPQ